MIERALVVESNYLSRKQIVQDLSAFQVASHVIEAESVRDGLTRLENTPLDACFIGPRLQPSTAMGFISQAKTLPLKQSTAFLVISRNDDKIANSVLSNVVDGTIALPYSQATFTEVVEKAIQHSRDTRRSIQSIADILVPEQVTNASPSSIASALGNLSIELRSIARAMTSGQLSLEADGSPSPAVAYAIRKALERTIPERNNQNKLSASDDYFVRSVAGWFTDRTRTSRERAVKALMQRLSEGNI